MSRIDPKMLAGLVKRGPGCGSAAIREPLVLAVDDESGWGDALAELCSFVDVRLTRVSATDDMAEILRRERPMAVVTSLDAAGRDACHVMKLVGEYDPDLPIMVLMGADAAMRGAAEAVQDLWELTEATVMSAPPSPGEMVEFLFRAGQQGHCLGLLPI